MNCKTKLTAAQRKARTTKYAAGAAFYAGAAASLAANVYASQHSFVGVATGVWSPMAALLALEMLERIPARGAGGVVRKIAVGLVALIAAYTSYWHLVHVFEMADADMITAYAGPLTVDLLMGLARVAMVHKTAPARPVRSPARKKVQLKSVA